MNFFAKVRTFLQNWSVPCHHGGRWHSIVRGGVDPEPDGPGESMANSNSDRCLLLTSLFRSMDFGDGGGSS